MIFRFVYRPFVKKDLQKAKEYYNAISPKLAKDFLFRIREAKKYIALNPEGMMLCTIKLECTDYINFLTISIILSTLTKNKLLFLRLNFQKEII